MPLIADHEIKIKINARITKKTANFFDSFRVINATNMHTKLEVNNAADPISSRLSVKVLTPGLITELDCESLVRSLMRKTAIKMTNARLNKELSRSDF